MTIRWTDTPVPMVLPTAPTPDGLPAGMPALHVDPGVDAQVAAHLDRADVERGGLLVGRAYADPVTGAVSRIDLLEAVPADASDGTAVSLRMGSGVWNAARDRLGADRRVVGWYHSHPGLTAFFSDTDRRTQRAFFGHAWSVGWVIDPLEPPGSAAREAFFVGPACRPADRFRSSCSPPP